jgi:hypothetical protein
MKRKNMKECAFCDHQGKLTAEHIVSDWMESLFPGKKAIRQRLATGKVLTRTASEMDFKAGVVCEPCNTGWMSNIESQYAIPTLTPMITGLSGISIGQAEAVAIASFAFLKAVVIDHSQRKNEPFFSRDARHAFRLTQSIPSNVYIWIFGYRGHIGSGRVKANYLKGHFSPSGNFELYVCTCLFGTFGFQLVAINQTGPSTISPTLGLDRYAVPISPSVPKNFVWPNPFLVANMEEFEMFVNRWNSVDIAG